MDKEGIEFLQGKAPFTPEVGVICGSGLSGLASIVQKPVVVQYKDIPGFPTTTVAGHKGELVFGFVGNNKTKVVLLKGRFHSYEGHGMLTAGLPARLFHQLGCNTMIVTNAAGGINSQFKIGDVMIMTDHIGIPLLSGKHPLVGPNDEKFGVRFPAMSEAYDKKLRNLFLQIKSELKADWIRPSGTYCMVSGPSYESAAESEFIRRIGGDAVGMSTVPEVVCAVHCGLRVFGLTLVTNMVALPNRQVPKANHEEVLAVVDERGKDICKAVEIFLNRINEDVPEPKVSENEILSELRQLDIANTTPLQALQLINKWKSNLE